MSHYLNYPSFTTHVVHENLECFEMIGRENTSTKKTVDLLTEIHKEIPLQYYTCRCFAGINFWYFAYRNAEERDKVAEQCLKLREEIKQKSETPKKEIPYDVQFIAQMFAEACSCPYKKF